MALRDIPGVDVRYHLLSYDAEGRERPEPDGSLGSKRIVELVRSKPVTDVFVASHGWKGDLPAAVDQYDRWFRRVAEQDADLAAVRARHPDFTPVVVGLHWPSLPWGDERLPPDGGLLGTDDQAKPDDEFAQEDELEVDTLVDLYAARIADTATARQALRVILRARPGPDDVLSPQVNQAYRELFAEAAPEPGPMTAAPGDDQEGFDPRGIIEEFLAGPGPGPERSPADLGLLDGDGGRRWSALDLVRMPLRQLSFWTMKKRSRIFGETGAHDLMRRLQVASPALRIHLMGHSFGCIVVTGAVAGSPDGPGLPRPVQTLYLVQGAMSLWSFASDVPYAVGATGYFERVRRDRLVAGVLVTTRTEHDTAVRTFYPKGAAVAGQLLLGEEYPAYGGLGTFGARGIPDAHDEPLLGTTMDYGFTPGGVWNLDANDVITTGCGPSGAHSDIDHDELAHASWQAVLACLQ